eukprot:5057609-Ditylum_brightwellii.AAC.1
MDAGADVKNDKDDNDKISIPDIVGEGEKIPVPDVPTVTVTQSGRVLRPPARLLNKYEFGRQLLDAKLGQDRELFGSVSLTPAEIKYYTQMRKLNKISCMSINSESLLQERECEFVGAAGDGFNHTSELKVMTYDQAMQTKDKVVWDQA